MTISAVLITKDESTNIEACLQTLNWVDEIIIIDSESTDDTVQKARKYTSKIYSSRFVDFSTQKNLGIEKSSGDWIFLIDADERVTPELAGEIKTLCTNSAGDAVYAVKRLTYFFGKRLNFSGTQNDYPIRLIPKGHGSYTQPVHEHILTGLPVKKLVHPMLHYSTRDMNHYQSKLDHYIPLEVKLMQQQSRKVSVLDLCFRPPLMFIHLYLVKLGLLDSIHGLQYALLSSFYVFRKYQLYLKPAETHAFSQQKRGR